MCSSDLSEALGGLGGVALMPQIIGTLLAIAVALVGGGAVYFLVRSIRPLRLTPEEEWDGADLAIHRISATPEEGGV